jgi:hypothetical protein
MITSSSPGQRPWFVSFRVGDIVATIFTHANHGSQGIGVVEEASEGYAESINWLIIPEPEKNFVGAPRNISWNNGQLRHATEPEKVLLRLTGKL